MSKNTICYYKNTICCYRAPTVAELIIKFNNLFSGQGVSTTQKPEADYEGEEDWRCWEENLTNDSSEEAPRGVIDASPPPPDVSIVNSHEPMGVVSSGDNNLTSNLLLACIVCMVILSTLMLGYQIYLLVNNFMESQDTEDANDADSYSYLPDGTTMTAGEIEELFTT